MKEKLYLDESNQKIEKAFYNEKNIICEISDFKNFKTNNNMKRTVHNTNSLRVYGGNNRQAAGYRVRENQ